MSRNTPFCRNSCGGVVLVKEQGKRYGYLSHNTVTKDILLDKEYHNTGQRRKDDLSEYLHNLYHWELMQGKRISNWIWKSNLWESNIEICERFFMLLTTLRLYRWSSFNRVEYSRNKRETGCVDCSRLEDMLQIATPGRMLTTKALQDKSLVVNDSCSCLINSDIP